jgi:hypothetical protein
MPIIRYIMNSMKIIQYNKEGVTMQIKSGYAKSKEAKEFRPIKLAFTGLLKPDCFEYERGE